MNQYFSEINIRRKLIPIQKQELSHKIKNAQKNYY